MKKNRIGRPRDNSVPYLFKPNLQIKENLQILDDLSADFTASFQKDLQQNNQMSAMRLFMIWYDWRPGTVSKFHIMIKLQNTSDKHAAGILLIMDVSQRKSRKD